MRSEKCGSKKRDRGRRCCARSWPVRSVIGSSRGATYANFSFGCTRTTRGWTRCCPTAGPRRIGEAVLTHRLAEIGPPPPGSWANTPVGIGISGVSTRMDDNFVPQKAGCIPMHEVTRILSAIEQGDPQAAEQLLPLVYDELRRLAAEKMAQEKPGQTLQATALVHEAYIRLVDVEKAQHWDSPGPLLRRRGRGHAADSGRERPSQRRAPNGGGQLPAHGPVGRRSQPIDDPRSTFWPWTRPSRSSSSSDPAEGRVGEAPVLRRADASSRRRRSSGSRAQLPSGLGLRSRLAFRASCDRA